jgi:hypothetical protein
MTTSRPAHVPALPERRAVEAPPAPETGNPSQRPLESLKSERPTHVREDCEICANRPHPRATHCSTCGALWKRESKTAHCPTCCGCFATPGVFDKHLKPANQRGCWRPETITKRGTSERVFADPTPNGYGTHVWHLVGDPDRKWSGPDTQLALIEDVAS